MNIKDSAGTIVIVLTLVGMFIALSEQNGDLGEQITRLRERITRVQVVMEQRLPRSPIAPTRNLTSVEMQHILR